MIFMYLYVFILLCIHTHDFFFGKSGGYPVEAQCSAVVENCLYCWKQVETVTLANGWESAYQFKSCVPWAVCVCVRERDRTCARACVQERREIV